MMANRFLIAIACAIGLAAAGCNQQTGVLDSPVNTVVGPTAAPAPRPTDLASILVSPAFVNAGGSVSGRALLNGPAGDGGVVVSLNANDDSVSLPSSLSFPAGSNSADFAVSTRVVTNDRQVVITASTTEKAATATLRVWADVPVFFSWVSEVGDSIGRGGFDKLTPPGTTFTATCDRNTLNVQMRTPNNEFWTAMFSGPSGVPLRQGVYEGATRAPFNTATPGLSIFGRGSGCNTLTGRFQIHDIDLQNNRVNRFHASFVQRCDGSSGLLTGDIRVVNMPASSSVVTCQR